VVSGFQPGKATVTIEMNNSANSADGSWAAVCAFQLGGTKTVAIAGRWFRARVTSYKAGTPAVNVGSNDAGTTFADIDVPMVAGPGTSVDVSALPPFKTVQVSGTFTGQLVIEVSTDGTSDWAPIVAFSSAGIQSFYSSAHHMRLSRQTPTAGFPTAVVGGASDESSAVSPTLFAMASISNSEGPVLTAGYNIASVAFTPPNLVVTFTEPSVDSSRENVQVTITSSSNPPNTVTGVMVDDNTAHIVVLDTAGDPVLVGCHLLITTTPS
jgi:hypothetical protein